MGQPIESDDVRGLLTEACPGLAEPFAEEDADSSERLSYLEINAAVRWLATRVRDGDQSCLPAVFEVAELVLIDGTKGAQRHRRRWAFRGPPKPQRHGRR